MTLAITKSHFFEQKQECKSSSVVGGRGVSITGIGRRGSWPLLLLVGWMVVNQELGTKSKCGTVELLQLPAHNHQHVFLVCHRCAFAWCPEHNSDQALVGKLCFIWIMGQGLGGHQLRRRRRSTGMRPNVTMQHSMPWCTIYGCPFLHLLLPVFVLGFEHLRKVAFGAVSQGGLALVAQQQLHLHVWAHCRLLAFAGPSRRHFNCCQVKPCLVGLLRKANGHLKVGLCGGLVCEITAKLGHRLWGYLEVDVLEN